MYDEAVEVVIREGRGSVSLLQRSLGIGYGRAARLIDFMAEDGVVGAYAGSNAREVLMTLEEFQELRGGEEEAKPAPKKKRNNKVAVEEDNDESDFITPRTAHIPVTKVIAADDDDGEEASDEFDEEDPPLKRNRRRLAPQQPLQDLHGIGLLGTLIKPPARHSRKAKPRGRSCGASSAGCLRSEVRRPVPLDDVHRPKRSKVLRRMKASTSAISASVSPEYALAIGPVRRSSRCRRCNR